MSQHDSERRVEWVYVVSLSPLYAVPAVWASVNEDDAASLVDRFGDVDTVWSIPGTDTQEWVEVGG
jgi:hypothetical protein